MPKQTADNEDKVVVILNWEEFCKSFSKEHQRVDQQCDQDFSPIDVGDWDLQMDGREYENNRVKKIAASEDEEVDILGIEEPSTSASKEHQIVEKQSDEDFSRMEVEDCDPQMDSGEGQPQLEKQPQIIDQSKINKENVEPTPLALAKDFYSDLATMFDPSSSECEILAAIILKAEKILDIQESQEEPKRFFVCSSEENMELNNIMRTCAKRKSVLGRQKTLQPHASTSTTTSPSVCDRYLKKLTVRLPEVSSSMPLQGVDNAAEQITTMTELLSIGAGLRKKSTKRRIFDDEEDEEDDEEMLKLANNEPVDWQKAIDFTQKQQMLKEIRQLKRLEAQPKKKRRVCANLFISCITSSVGEELSGELPHTQMEAVYLQSINSPPRRRPGAFKIPEFRIFNDREQIYSQAAPTVEDASQYALDSFVVKEHDDEQARMSKRRQRKATKEGNDDASLCPLERAEKLLKQERRLKRLRALESSVDDNDFE